MNYLVRLGWSHGDQELFTWEELLELFTTEGLSRSPAAFDPEKLLWVNAQYIQKTPPHELAGRLAGYLEVAGLPVPDKRYLTKMLPLFQPRAKTLVEMAEACRPMVQPAADLDYDPKAVAKFLTPEARELLVELRALMVDAESFDQAAVEALLQGFCEQKGVKFKVIAQPLRVALTGRTASPGLYEMLEVLGQDEAVLRLDRALLLETGGAEPPAGAPAGA